MQEKPLIVRSLQAHYAAANQALAKSVEVLKGLTQ